MNTNKHQLQFLQDQMHPLKECRMSNSQVYQTYLTTLAQSTLCDSAYVLPRSIVFFLTCRVQQFGQILRGWECLCSDKSICYYLFSLTVFVCNNTEHGEGPELTAGQKERDKLKTYRFLFTRKIPVLQWYVILKLTYSHWWLRHIYWDISPNCYWWLVE